jgi:hypothetical protein
MSDPLVSIIIVYWNDPEFVRKCLQSVEQLDYSNLEIIVVDNGSTDDSAPRVQTEFPRVQLLRVQINCGFARANNIGIRASKGKYVVLLNSDTTVEKDWIRRQVEVCEKDPGVGMCGGRMRLMREPEKINSIGMILTRAGLAQHIGDGEVDRGQYEQQRPIFGVSGACAFCRREMLDRIGLLDEDLFAYYEDVDLSWRAWLGGWKCVYVPSAVLYHYRNVTMSKDESLVWEYRFLRQRNRLWVLATNLSVGSLLRFSPWLLAHELEMLGKGIKAWLTRSRPPTELRAWREAVRQLGRTWRKRRARQSARVFPESELRKLAFAPLQ